MFEVNAWSSKGAKGDTLLTTVHTSGKDVGASYIEYHQVKHFSGDCEESTGSPVNGAVTHCVSQKMEHRVVHYTRKSLFVRALT